MTAPDCPTCDLEMDEVAPGVFLCISCDYEEWLDYQPDEFPSELQHAGFWTNVDGVMVHVQGDVDMPPEAMEALEKIIRAAIKAVDEGKL